MWVAQANKTSQLLTPVLNFVQRMGIQMKW